MTLQLGELNGFIVADKALEDTQQFNKIVLLTNNCLAELNALLNLKLTATEAVLKPNELFRLGSAELIVALFDKDKATVSLNKSVPKNNVPTAVTVDHNVIKLVNTMKPLECFIYYLAQIDRFNYASSCEELKVMLEQELNLPSVFLNAITSYVSYKLFQARSPDVTGKANNFNTNLTIFQQEVQKLTNLGYKNTLEFNTDFLFNNSGLI